MMHEFQCLACGGRYFEADRHGVFYAHACGPLPATKKEPARERPDKRDENHAVDREGTVLGIKSEGKGVKCLSDPKLKAPRWITKLKQYVDKRRDKDAPPLSD